MLSTLELRIIRMGALNGVGVNFPWFDKWGGWDFYSKEIDWIGGNSEFADKEFTKTDKVCTLAAPWGTGGLVPPLFARSIF